MDIEDFLGYLKNELGLKPQTRNRGLYCLRSFYRYLNRKGICDHNPAANVDAVKQHRKEREYLSEREYEALLKHVKAYHMKVVVMTLYYTGLRVSECTGLTMQDVDLFKGVIHVVGGKGGKDRDIPINDKLLSELKAYVRERRVNAEPWQRFFATPSTGKIHPSYIGMVLTDAEKAAGLRKHVTPHTLRHSFASTLVKKGVSLVQVQKLLGHSSLAVTSIYTHATFEELADAVNVL